MRADLDGLERLASGGARSTPSRRSAVGDGPGSVAGDSTESGQRFDEVREPWNARARSPPPADAQADLRAAAPGAHAFAVGLIARDRALVLGGRCAAGG